MTHHTPRRTLAAGLIAIAQTAVAQTPPLDEDGFTRHVAEQLRSRIPGAEVVVKGPLTVGFGALQANLDRIYRFCRQRAPACEDEVRRYVDGAVEVHRERSAPPRREAVRLVLRSEDYARAANRQLGADAPPTRPFPGGLVVMPALDGPRTLRMLAAKDAQALGTDDAGLYALGLDNLRATLPTLMDVAKVAGPGQIGRLHGDTTHPSRLLLIDAWTPLVQAQGGVLIAAAPTTDTVLYIGEDSPQAIDALRALVKQIGAEAPNPLSAVLLRWKPQGWSAVP